MERIKKILMNKWYKLINYIDFYRKLIDKRYGLHILNIKYWISEIFITSIISLIFVIFLYLTGILKSEEKDIILELNIIDNQEIIIQLLVTQISTTFITTAIIALLPNLEERYLLGERALDRIFGDNKFGITKINVILFAIMMFNIYISIFTTYTGIAVLLFAITILLIVVCIVEITNIFIVPNRIKGRIKYEYYKESLKLLKKNKPLKRFYNVKLVKYKEVILKQIINKNVEYVHNIEEYKKILEAYLFNNGLKVQEYYTEFLKYDDVIEHIIIFVQELIKNNEHIKAYYLYNYLLERLNYYNIYISSIYLRETYDMFINKIYDMDNLGELMSYSKKIYGNFSMEMIVNNLEQAYFKLNNDFSYTRLGKLNMKFLNYGQNISTEYISKIY